MRALTGELLLSAWDRCDAEHDVDRALTLLELSTPELDREQLAELSIAERNALLLRLRAITFGPVLGGYANCSACGAPLEFTLPVEALLSRTQQQLPAGGREWTEDAQTFRLRPVNSNDLLATLSAPDGTVAEELLVSRCLTLSEPRKSPMRISPSIRGQFEQVNGAAEIVCALDCPGCSAHETLDFDIVRFLWTEVQRAARRLLGEIHELACAYGWSEKAIVSMSPSRRNAYREMLNA